jgi:hypothetical protein
MDWTLLKARFWAFVGKFPDLLVEGVSGTLFVIGAVLAVHFAQAYPYAVALGLATAGSLLYEWKLDANGFSLKDVAQRECGVLLAVGVVRLFHLL